jgi:hypothetical protein
LKEQETGRERESGPDDRQGQKKPCRGTQMKAKKSISLIGLLIVVLFPLSLYGQEQEGRTADQKAAISPPVAQPLVPEGVFALELVKALRIGQAQNEAQAESMLSAVAVEPRNGWIAEYPVTPDILGEIDESVAAAAEAGKLGMAKDQAREAVKDLVARLGLNVTPGPPPFVDAVPGRGPGNGEIYKYVDQNGVVHFTDRYESIPAEYRNQIEMVQKEVQPYPASQQVPEMQPPDFTPNPFAGNHYVASPNPEVIDNYYYNDGPPVVTYYAPPWPYYYLYAWVPYPFWCSSFFFPGFYILRDFHRTVWVDQRILVVTNHVAHPKNKTVVVLDPVNRNPRGRAAVNPGTPRHGFMAPSAQAGARAIVEFSRQRGRPVRTKTGTGIRKAVPPPLPGGLQTQVTPNQNPGNPGKTPPARMYPRTATNPPANSSSLTGGKGPLRPSIAEKGKQRGNQTENPAAANSISLGRRGTWAGAGKSVTLPAGNSRRMNPPAIASRPPMEQRHPVMPGNIGNQKAGHIERPPVNEGRNLSPASTGGRAVTSTPAGRAPGPPSVSQKGGFGAFPRGGRGSF